MRCFIESVQPAGFDCENKFSHLGGYIGEHEKHVFEEEGQLGEVLKPVQIELFADVGIDEFVQREDLLVKRFCNLINSYHIIINKIISSGLLFTRI